MTKPSSGGNPGTLLVHIPNHSFPDSIREFTIEFLVRNPDASAVTFDITLYLNVPSPIKVWSANSAPGSATTNFRLTFTHSTSGVGTNITWSIRGDTTTSGKTLYFSEIDFTVREIPN